jgi:TetR/AcrR family transcriptional repressor of mexJK operon
MHLACQRKNRARKFEAITRAASEMFLAEGFDRASLDQIAQRAGVSKQTIYAHFADKEALFKAICAELTDRLTIPLRQPTQKQAKLDLEGTLARLGDQALAMMLHPASLDLHRLVINAAARFPELGRAAYEAGAQRMIDDLSAVLVERSHLRDGLPDVLPEAEARRLVEQFMGMLRGFHQIRGLLGVAPVTPGERKAYVRSCVAILLRGAAGA